MLLKVQTHFALFLSHISLKKIIEFPCRTVSNRLRLVPGIEEVALLAQINID